MIRLTWELESSSDSFSEESFDKFIIDTLGVNDFFVLKDSLVFSSTTYGVVSENK